MMMMMMTVMRCLACDGASIYLPDSNKSTPAAAGVDLLLLLLCTLQYEKPQTRLSLGRCAFSHTAPLPGTVLHQLSIYSLIRKCLDGG